MPPEPMAFRIKHILFGMTVVAIGLAALLNAGTPFVSELCNLFTLSLLIAAAYGIWLSGGETRAFRIGFLAWGAAYCWSFSWNFNIGIARLLDLAANILEQRTLNAPDDDLFGTPFYSDFEQRFSSIANCLLLLLFGLIGGCVTVYFYRKRQRMLETQS